MARIQAFEPLNFTPSNSPDAVNHRLRAFPSGADLVPNEVYAAPYANVGNDGMIDAAELTDVLPDADGRYDLYLTSVDDAGNESDFVLKVDVPFDLVAPNPPAWL